MKMSDGVPWGWGAKGIAKYLQDNMRRTKNVETGFSVKPYLNSPLWGNGTHSGQTERYTVGPCLGRMRTPVPKLSSSKWRRLFMCIVV